MNRVLMNVFFFLKKSKVVWLVPLIITIALVALMLFSKHPTTERPYGYTIF